MPPERWSTPKAPRYVGDAASEVSIFITPRASDTAYSCTPSFYDWVYRYDVEQAAIEAAITQK